MITFPEGETVLSSDNEWRVTAKWANSVYATVGNVATPFPEGSEPMMWDSEDRLKEKINAMLGV